MGMMDDTARAACSGGRDTMASGATKLGQASRLRCFEAMRNWLVRRGEGDSGERAALGGVLNPGGESVPSNMWAGGSEKIIDLC
jgi:hypothetical protein